MNSYFLSWKMRFTICFVWDTVIQCVRYLNERTGAFDPCQGGCERVEHTQLIVQ